MFVDKINDNLICKMVMEVDLFDLFPIFWFMMFIAIVVFGVLFFIIFFKVASLIIKRLEQTEGIGYWGWSPFPQLLSQKKDDEERIRESGEKGEANVRYHLKWLDGYKVLHNVRLPNPLESQEIDHIVIGKNGVFHLETKNYGGEHGGKIVINENDNWTLIKNNDIRGIENPLFQVRRHERVLKEYIEKEFPDKHIPVKEIIVLSNEKTIVEGYENSPITVLKMERLNEFITNYSTEITLDEKTINLLYESIKKYSKEDIN